MKKLNKTVKIILITITTIVTALALTCAILFIPRVGKEPDDYVWNGADSFDISKIVNLEMKVDSDFKILQITDTQLDFPIKSRKTLEKVIDTLITENRPDMIVITGDVVAGVFTHFDVNYIIKLFDSYKIPWAPVFGNHDRELNANLYYQSQQYYKSEYCLFKEGPNNVDGVGNYVVNIKRGEEIVYTTFMMDSKGSRKFEVNGVMGKHYDYINDSQINWYADNVNGIAAESKKIVPSMTFFHIPLPEFQTAYDLAMAGSPEATILSGEKREGIGSSPINGGFFQKMLDLKSTTHIFVGHEHINNFSVLYKGITMTYGTKTGNFNTYDKDMNGGTLITIAKDGTVSVDIKLVQI